MGVGRLWTAAAVVVAVAGCGASADPEAQPAVTLVTATPVAPSAAPTNDAPPTYALRVDEALTVREGPGTQFAAIGSVPASDPVTVVCSSEGEPIRDPDGVLVARWDRISSPAAGYVAGAFVDTGGVDPDVEACQFVPKASEQADAVGLFERVSDGVVRIETTTCDGGDVGSGFLIAPDLVATVAHVVEGAASITLRAGDEVTSGEVIGMDSGREVALVRAGQPLSGHVFTIADASPTVGADVLAIGYPLGNPISLTRGTVSAVGRTIDTGDQVLSDMIQTDAAINPGNSGGPLLDLDGDVLGLAELVLADNEGDAYQGLAYAVSAQTAQPLLTRWIAEPQAVPTGARCAAPSGSSDGYVNVQDYSDHPEGPVIAQTMRAWADGINVGSYQESWDMYSQRHRNNHSFTEFADGNRTSLISELFVWSVEGAGDNGTLTANMGFISVQDPQYGPNGQSCSFWDLNYGLVWERDAWRIDTVSLFDGQEPEAC